MGRLRAPPGPRSGASRDAIRSRAQDVGAATIAADVSLAVIALGGHRGERRRSPPISINAT